MWESVCLVNQQFSFFHLKDKVQFDPSGNVRTPTLETCKRRDKKRNSQKMLRVHLVVGINKNVSGLFTISFVFFCVLLPYIVFWIITWLVRLFHLFLQLYIYIVPECCSTLLVGFLLSLRCKSLDKLLMNSSYFLKDVQIGQRMITISTVGVPNTIKRLASHKLQSTLAVR